MRLLMWPLIRKPGNATSVTVTAKKAALMTAFKRKMELFTQSNVSNLQPTNGFAGWIRSLLLNSTGSLKVFLALARKPAQEF